MSLLGFWDWALFRSQEAVDRPQCVPYSMRGTTAPAGSTHCLPRVGPVAHGGKQGGRNHIGEAQNYRQQLGIAECAGTVADRNPVGKFSGDRDKMFAGGNAGKPAAHTIEWSIGQVLSDREGTRGADPG